MHSVFFVAWSILLLSSITQVLADNTITTTQISCRTLYTSTSISSVPTTSTTSSRADTYTAATSTFTPLTTITPSTIIVTSTVQALLLKKETVNPTQNPIVTTTTQTFTKKSYSSSTTITTTGFNTAYAQSTLVFTRTDGPGASVIPVLDTLPGALPPNAPAKRGLPDELDLSRRQNSLRPQYPNQVFCVELQRIIIIRQSTITGPVATYTALPAIRNTTITTTQPTTTTYYSPNTYSTITSTLIKTTTIGIVSTTISYAAVNFETTTTAVAAVATGYPQCLSRNQALKIQSQPVALDINYWNPINANTSDVREWGTPIGSIEECCSACLDDPTCSHSLYYVPKYLSGTCRLWSRANGVCDATDPLRYNAQTNGRYLGYVVANNKCGQWVSTSPLF